MGIDLKEDAVWSKQLEVLKPSIQTKKQRKGKTKRKKSTEF